VTVGLNSGGVVTKIMAAELSHTSNRARIFSILSPSFSIGMVMGTFLGGVLAHPFGRLPSFLGGSSPFWHRHPYALPCVVVGALDAITILVGLLFLVETRRPSDRSASSPEKSRPKNQFAAALKVPGFILLTAVFLLFQVSTFSWDGMYTVYTYTQPELGGLGLSVDTIGLLYSVNYLVSFAMNPIFLPRMTKRWGSTLALGIVLAMWPTLTLLIPLTQWLALHARWAMWGVIAVQLSMRAVGAFGWA
jgi:predicted MFS family arabinose efflux permease